MSSKIFRDKLKSLDELRQIVSDWRQKQESVVFANGCFDILHVGHIRYLRGARAEGDHLIVAINNDTSVRELKGPGRPILAENDRAELVAALEMVDFVHIFAGLTVHPLLQNLRPDVHAKGTDYSEESVPERDTVLSYGGRIAIVGDPKNHSTRDLLDDIRRKD